MSVEKKQRRPGRLCELTVIKRSISVCQIIVMQNAWEGGQDFVVYGWV